jgi:large subunit ribosomal protein L15
LPKRGFRNPFAIEVAIVNVGALELFAAGTNVDEDFLREKRLVQGRDVLVKILGNGELTKALTVTAHKFSVSAVVKIEAAGGKAIVISAEETAAEAS